MCRWPLTGGSPAIASVVLVVVSGLPASARQLLPVELRGACERCTCLSTLSKTGLLEAGLEPGRTTGVAAYEAVAAAARQNLVLGTTVGVDAVNDSDGARATWRRAAAGAGVEVRFFVLLPPSKAEHQRRLRVRDRGHRHVQEPSWLDVVDRARDYEPSGDAAVALDATAPAEALADDVLAALGEPPVSAGGR
jgi:predicted kinase